MSRRLNAARMAEQACVKNIAYAQRMPGLSDSERNEIVSGMMEILDDNRHTIAELTPLCLTIGAMKRQTSERKTSTLIKLELMKLNARLNLNHPMTEDDIEFVADDILTTYPALTIADLSVIMDNIVRGKYGDLYERISAAKILPIFERYMDERMAIAEHRSIADHQQRMSKVPDMSDLDDVHFYARMKSGREQREAEQEQRQRDEEAARKEFVKYKLKQLNLNSDGTPKE